MSVIITSDRHENEYHGVNHLRIPTIRWGAIAAGLVAGLAVLLLLTVLGLAVGLSAADMPRNSDAGTWLAAWQGLSMLASAFVGAYVAGRMCGLLRKSDGLLHGFVAWSATTVLIAFLSLTVVGSFLGGIFYNGQPVAVTPSSIQDPMQISDDAAQAVAPAAQNITNDRAEPAATVSWSVFAAIALSLVFGLGGGAFGVINSRRLPRSA